MRTVALLRYSSLGLYWFVHFLFPSIESLLFCLEVLSSFRRFTKCFLRFRFDHRIICAITRDDSLTGIFPLILTTQRNLPSSWFFPYLCFFHFDCFTAGLFFRLIYHSLSEVFSFLMILDDHKNTIVFIRNVFS